MSVLLSTWAVSDGRAGIENQALGLAEAVARLTPTEIVRKRIAYRGPIRRLPTSLNLFPRAALADTSDPVAPPWPDIWIAAGRATLPLSLRVKRWSQGRTFVVQLQDPGLAPGRFDLVVPPTHDRLTGENVFPILGSPNRVTRERLASEREAFRPRIDPLPSPRIAVLVGGTSKAYRLTARRAARLGQQIASAAGANGGSVLLTFSRRTPPDARAPMTQALSDVPGWIWDGEGANPYFAFLGAADFILVTEDSTNMAVEAAATGKPVYVLGLEGGAPKFERLHAELRRLGVSRPFEGALQPWSYEPLRETERAAAEVLRRLAVRRGA